MNAQLEYMLRVLRVNPIVGHELLRLNQPQVPLIITGTDRQKKKLQREARRKGIKVVQ